MSWIGCSAGGAGQEDSEGKEDGGTGDLFGKGGRGKAAAGVA